MRKILILAGLVLAATVAVAADFSGSVVAIRNGRLERFQMPLWQSLAVGDAVRLEERLKTQPASLAVLNLPQSGRFVLGPDTEMVLGGQPGAVRADLARGAVWIEADLKPGGSLAVQTALASTGVRGTKFTVIYDDQGLEVCTCKGGVAVTLQDGRLVETGSGRGVSLDGAGGLVNGDKAGLDVLAWTEKPGGRRYEICAICHTATGLKPGWEKSLAAQP